MWIDKKRIDFKSMLSLTLLVFGSPSSVTSSLCSRVGDLCVDMEMNSCKDDVSNFL